MIEMPAHAVAAVFLFGRESPFLTCFEPFLPRCQATKESRKDVLSVSRSSHRSGFGRAWTHSEVMLTELCGHDEKWQSAARVGKMALSLRVKLWDSVLDPLILDPSDSFIKARGDMT